jgi:acyl carrier protein
LFRAIKDLSPADAQAHFRTKVQGCYVLQEVLDGQALDFCLLTSSLASVLGGLGLAAYAAANSFMDALACRHNQTYPTPWLSVNWDAWQLTTQDYVAVGNPFADLAITAAEGADAFRRLLSLGPASQVLVSTSNLQARIAQWATSRSPREAEREPQEEGAIKAPRPNLQTAYVAPRDDVERQIAQVWQEMLGVEQVGVYDNFFDLGGNSLVGVQLIARLTEEWQVQIPAVSLYEGPTINALAKIISQLTGDGVDEGPAYEASRSRGERRREKIRRRRQA